MTKFKKEKQDSQGRKEILKLCINLLLFFCVMALLALFVHSRYHPNVILEHREYTFPTGRISFFDKDRVIQQYQMDEEFQNVLSQEFSQLTGKNRTLFETLSIWRMRSKEGDPVIFTTVVDYDGFDTPTMIEIYPNDRVYVTLLLEVNKGWATEANFSQHMLELFKSLENGD